MPNEHQEVLGRLPKCLKSNPKQDCGRIHAAGVHPTPSELRERSICSRDHLPDGEIPVGRPYLKSEMRLKIIEKSSKITFSDFCPDWLYYTPTNSKSDISAQKRFFRWFHSVFPSPEPIRNFKQNTRYDEISMKTHRKIIKNGIFRFLSRLTLLYSYYLREWYFGSKIDLVWDF